MLDRPEHIRGERVIEDDEFKSPLDVGWGKQGLSSERCANGLCPCFACEI
jgi:hypothetical protein